MKSKINHEKKNRGKINKTQNIFEMSAKFVAFENEASTSRQANYYANDYDEGQDERIEMNVNQYPNYQSQTNHGDVTALGASPYGVVDDEEENDLTDDLQEKERKNVGYRKFIYNNSEQFKPIIGGKRKIYSFFFVLFVCVSVWFHVIELKLPLFCRTHSALGKWYPYCLRHLFCIQFVRETRGN